MWHSKPPLTVKLSNTQINGRVKKRKLSFNLGLHCGILPSQASRGTALFREMRKELCEHLSQASNLCVSLFPFIVHVKISFIYLPAVH